MLTFLLVLAFATNTFAVLWPDEFRLLPVDEWQALKSKGVVNVNNITCKCSNQSWCNPITKQYNRELFGFMASKNMSHMNWTYVTTVAWPATNDVCTAHEHGARAVAAAPNPPFTTNATVRKKYVDSVVEQLLVNHMDGVTFDYEWGMSMQDKVRPLYTLIVNETAIAIHKAIPGSQVSVCVTWVRNGNLRYYDYASLSNATDLFYIMDYNTQYNLWDRCLADANCPIEEMGHGIGTYKEVGIPANKLIAGLPWYGNSWPCIEMESDTSSYCQVAAKRYQDAQCSQAGAAALSYLQILDYITAGLNVTEIRYDNATVTNFFNVKLDGQIHQMWYDNATTLKKKYELALNGRYTKIKGVGPFAFRWFTDANFSHEEEEIAMWSVFDEFFKGNK